MLLIPNCRFIHPLAEEISISVFLNDGVTPGDVDEVVYPLTVHRSALEYSQIASNTTIVTLPWNPVSNQWVEIYLDGIRVTNTTTDFEIHYNDYTIVDNVITFNEPLTGNLQIFCDNKVQPSVRDENIIRFDNIQGSEVPPTTAGQTVAGTWCEPFVCAQPIHGFARVTDDRQAIMYVPNPGYTGLDAFSYALVSQRGQLSKPKCVYVDVREPPPPPPPEEGG